MTAFKFKVSGPLAPIAEKVRRGERLDREDGVALFKTNDIFTLGYLANQVRDRVHGDKTFYTHTLHVNYSNACVLDCALCAYYRPLDSEEAYTFSVEQMAAQAEAAGKLGVREFHITGGLNPKLPFEYYENMFRGLRAKVPWATIKAFTAVEIDFFSKKFRMTVEEIYRRLGEAGLNCLPGGGAEILVDRVRDIVCKGKISAARWLEVHEIGHRAGFPSNATMLYGHVETLEDRVDHMLKLRGVQDRTQGFLAFVPLSFHAENTAMPDLKPTTGIEDLKVYAVSRLMLDNVPHIKLLWTYVGTKLLQVALDFGVDDVGSTNMEERIVKAAGADHGDRPTRDELMEMIRHAGRTPCEVDSLYREGPVQMAGELVAPSPVVGTECRPVDVAFGDKTGDGVARR
ncbi:MAG: CofH family radical SAM protein [Candidatus Omnitrophica bacterium]|nr:CofH family radical SAM protein [Candidatus Omnitrophota bacterium]